MTRRSLILAIPTALAAATNSNANVDILRVDVRTREASGTHWSTPTILPGSLVKPFAALAYGASGIAMGTLIIVFGYHLARVVARAAGTDHDAGAVIAVGDAGAHRTTGHTHDHDHGHTHDHEHPDETK